MAAATLARRGGIIVLALASGVSASAAGAAGQAVGRQADGSVVTSTNQRLTPAGQQVEWRAGRPTAVTLSPDGTTAAFLNGDGLAGPEVVTVNLASGAVTNLDPGSEAGSFDGIAYSPDGATIYAADAGGTLQVIPASGGQVSSIAMPGSNPDPGGLALSPDGGTAYVALSRNNTLAVVDLAAGTVTREIPVGNAPHSVVLSGGLAYVSDEGGRRPVPGDRTNDSSGTRVVADAQDGAASTGAVSVVDVAAGKVVGSVEVGLHPTALPLAGGDLFVANTNSDTVSVVDLALRRVVTTIGIVPFPGAPYGSQPTGLALLSGGRLAVSLGRSNAVAVYDYLGPNQPVAFQGLIPTGWYPSSLAVDRAGRRLVVANDKGVGSTMVSDLDPAGVAPKLVQEYVASASLIPFPSSADLARGTVQVAANNGWNAIDTACPDTSVAPAAIPAHVGEPSLIKHVIFVVKENRSYDQVLGDDTRGNGAPAQAAFGQNVTPNQHALARMFPLLDNFYDSGSLSADGHQWVVQADAPDYLEKAFSFPRSYPAMGFDALAYLPSGFLWENAVRHGRSVVNYAEYALEGGQLPEYSDIPSNDRLIVRDYPGFALNIPDQQRADIFLRHFQDNVKQDSLANLTFIRLPDDHTGGTNPSYPTPAAEVADNDLALGRIVDAVSHSQFWKDTAFFVEEDDSQTGTDHVDGHRSGAFVISPYAKHGGVVDSTYYTQVNVVRTIEQILGLPAMNQMDLAAAPMRAAFTNVPDLTPYTVIANRVALGAMNPSLASLSGLAKEWAQASMAQNLSRSDAADPAVINRADWYSVEGFSTPYPGDPRVLHPWEVARLTARPEVEAAPPAPVRPPGGARPGGVGGAATGAAAPLTGAAAPACRPVGLAARQLAPAVGPALPLTGRGFPGALVAALLLGLGVALALLAPRRRPAA